MTQSSTSRTPQFPSARLRVVVSVIAGFVGAAFIDWLGAWQLAPLGAWDTAAVVYMIWTWTILGSLDAKQTATHAASEDPTRGASDALLLVASVASLAAVGLLIVSSSSQSGLALGLQIGLGLMSVVLSWAIVHTVYALKYARLYYTSKTGSGVGFNETDGPPSYADFAYLAFTIGMTFQVSDTALHTKVFRATALRHSLLSYLFGTIIVATTINLIAGLGK